MSTSPPPTCPPPPPNLHSQAIIPFLLEPRNDPIPGRGRKRNIPAGERNETIPGVGIGIASPLDALRLQELLCSMGCVLKDTSCVCKDPGAAAAAASATAEAVAAGRMGLGVYISGDGGDVGGVGDGGRDGGDNSGGVLVGAGSEDAAPSPVVEIALQLLLVILPSDIISGGTFSRFSSCLCGFVLELEACSRHAHYKRRKPSPDPRYLPTS